MAALVSALLVLPLAALECLRVPDRERGECGERHQQLGVGQLVLTIRFAMRRTVGTARALFYGSITYLPLLWILMLADRV